jgi:hypothetical protein
MKSKIKELALQKGFKNIQRFALEAKMPWQLARNIWDGDISNKSLKTLDKAAVALNVTVADLYDKTA